MANLLKKFWDWLLGLFWSTEMDITVVGLQKAGKTSLLRILAGGEFTTDSLPTVGFALKRVQKGHVTLKCWDIGGQVRFRSTWERYCRGASAIVFVVDSADGEALPVACEELHMLLQNQSLEVDELIEQLELKKISHREVSCYGISAKQETNLDAVVQWLITKTKK